MCLCNKKKNQRNKNVTLQLKKKKRNKNVSLQ